MALEKKTQDFRKYFVVVILSQLEMPTEFSIKPPNMQPHLSLHTSRRAALQATCGGFLGLSTANILRAQAGTKAEPKAKSVIHLHLGGGFAQQESFDPKPEAPSEYRGAFNITKTNTGDIFSENFARTAKIADKISVIRSCYCRIPDHNLATYHLFTGYLPTPVIDFPQMGAVVAREYGPRKQMPPYVAVPNNTAQGGGTGYLSSKYGAFELGADPGGRGEFRVKDMTIPPGYTLERLERQRAARELVGKKIRSIGADLDKVDTIDQFGEQAWTLISSEKAQSAFSLKDEPEHIQKLYGSGYILNYRRQPAAVNERLLLARRLVEAGVRFVTINYGGWDNHVDVKSAFEDKAPPLDHAIAGLITDLDQRGMLDETLVMITSEFGRTPKINKDSGRDHWARVYSMILAGGGIKRGYIHGSSDSTSSEPASDPVVLEDFLYTVYHQLGIDANEEILAFGTRPIEIVNGGKLVEKLLA